MRTPMVKPFMNRSNPSYGWNCTSTMCSSYATLGSNLAVALQVEAQGAQDEAQDPRSIHTLDEIRADTIVLGEERGVLLDEIIRGDSR
jgi:hypothetical protein